MSCSINLASLKASKFLNTSRLENYCKWKKLLTPLNFDDVKNGLITVPHGFITDGASIPRACWGIIGVTPYSPTIVDPAVLHDWLYASKIISRKEADRTFKRAMQSQGLLGKVRIALIYRSVRTFGWVNYRRYKPRFCEHTLKNHG